MKKVIIACLLILLLISSTCLAAASTKLVNKVDSALKTIKNWIIKIATPAAAVAVGVGVLMKKFSFGDDDRIAKGKKLIRSTLFSYAFILCIDTTLTVIESLAK